MGGGPAAAAAWVVVRLVVGVIASAVAQFGASQYAMAWRRGTHTHIHANGPWTHRAMHERVEQAVPHTRRTRVRARGVTHAGERAADWWPFAWVPWSVLQRPFAWLRFSVLRHWAEAQHATTRTEAGCTEARNRANVEWAISRAQCTSTRTGSSTRDWGGARRIGWRCSARRACHNVANSMCRRGGPSRGGAGNVLWGLLRPDRMCTDRPRTLSCRPLLALDGLVSAGSEWAV